MTATSVPSTQLDSTQTIAVPIRDTMTLEQFEERGIKLDDVFEKSFRGVTHCMKVIATHSYGWVSYTETRTGKLPHTDSINAGVLLESVYHRGYSLVRPEFAR